MTVKELLKIFPNANSEFLSQNASDFKPSHSPQKPIKTIPIPLSVQKKTDLAITITGQINFTIPFAPIGKPRMTRSDKWKKRPAVVKWHQWKDAARPHVPENLLQSPVSVSWTAYFPFPKTYSASKKASFLGKPHQQKPDRDNIDKLICDFLFEQDKGIAFGVLRKFWDDGNGPRIEIEIA